MFLIDDEKTITHSLNGISIAIFQWASQVIDTFSCAFDTILHRDIEANPKLKNAISSHLHGAQRFREKNPNLVLPPKPMPEPPCDVCLLSITPGCYKTKYILPVIYNGDTATEYKSKSIWVMNCEAAIAHEGGNWFILCA